MNADSRIRCAETRDLAAIAAIYNESIAAEDASMDIKVYAPEDIQGWLDAFNEREGLFVLEDEGELQGWGIIKRYSNRWGYRVACETAVYTWRHARRRGYGSSMKKELIRQCKRLGYHHLVAKIFSDNKGSIIYNLKLGYEIVGQQREIGFKNGGWQDVTIMQLILEDVPPPQDGSQERWL